MAVITSAVQYDVLNDGSVVKVATADFKGETIPVGSCIWDFTGLDRPGYLSLNKYNGLLQRSEYPQMWATIEAMIANLGSNSASIVLTDAAWLAEVEANKVEGIMGICGKFSRGDGSTTFRLPYIPYGFLRTQDAEDMPINLGSYQPDQMRPITGAVHENITGAAINPVGAMTTNIVSSGVLTPGTQYSVATLGINTGLLGGNFNGTDTHPRSVAANLLMKVIDTSTYPSVINPSVEITAIDSGELSDSLAITLMPSVRSDIHDFLQASTTNGRRGLVLKGNTYIKLTNANGNQKVFGTSKDIVIDDAQALLDTGTTFANGVDYYVFLCANTNWTSVELKVSFTKAAPVGFAEENCRLIGGFHTLCANAGTLPADDLGRAHPASGYLAGDIIPNSVWCLSHRSAGGFQEGTAYVKELDEWWFIYLQSGTGLNTASTFGGTITNNRGQVFHDTDVACVGYRLPSDHGFTEAAYGSNANTNIAGSAQVTTTGGHVDTAGRRMISRHFLEDMCGCYWQWCEDLGFNGQTGWTTVGLGSTYGVPYALLAGSWDDGACGPRSRSCSNSRLGVDPYVSGRGRSGSLRTL